MIRAIANTAAAIVTTCNGRPAIFIPVCLPDAVIRATGERIEVVQATSPSFLALSVAPREEDERGGRVASARPSMSTLIDPYA